MKLTPYSLPRSWPLSSPRQKLSIWERHKANCWTAHHGWTCLKRPVSGACNFIAQIKLPPVVCHRFCIVLRSGWLDSLPFSLRHHPLLSNCSPHLEGRTPPLNPRDFGVFPVAWLPLLCGSALLSALSFLLVVTSLPFSPKAHSPQSSLLIRTQILFREHSFPEQNDHPQTLTESAIKLSSLLVAALVWMLFHLLAYVCLSHLGKLLDLMRRHLTQEFRFPSPTLVCQGSIPSSSSWIQLAANTDSGKWWRWPQVIGYLPPIG